jgi:hypothetical protein
MNLQEQEMNEKTKLAERDQDALAGRENDQAARRMTITPAVDVFEDSRCVTLWADLPRWQVSSFESGESSREQSGSCLSRLSMPCNG